MKESSMKTELNSSDAWMGKDNQQWVWETLAELSQIYSEETLRETQR